MEQPQTSAAGTNGPKGDCTQMSGSEKGALKGEVSARRGLACAGGLSHGAVGS